MHGHGMLLERLREFRIVRGSVVFYVLSWCSMLSCAFVFIRPASWGHLDRFIRVLDTPSFTLVLLAVRCPLCQAASPGFKDTLRAPIILLCHSVLQCACLCPLYIVTQNDVRCAVAATLAVALKAGVAGHRAWNLSVQNASTSSWWAHVGEGRSQRGCSRERERKTVPLFPTHALTEAGCDASIEAI